MYKYTAGFVGAGNMGGALAQAVCKKIDGENVIVSCKTTEEADAVSKRLGCKNGTAEDVVKSSEFVFLAIKPQMINDVAKDLKNAFDENKDCIIVSMLAGVTTDTLKEYFGNRKIIRIMPNTPAMVGEGMMLVSGNKNVGEGDISKFKDIMSMSGKLDEIPESLIDAATAVSGCGPAFVYMFIEALADGGVKCGLAREKAIKYAAQTLLGSAKMVLETGRHPEELKDAVCSPGGSTIAGVHSLEKGAFRNSAIDAVEASYKKTQKLG